MALVCKTSTTYYSKCIKIAFEYKNGRFHDGLCALQESQSALLIQEPHPYSLRDCIHSSSRNCIPYILIQHLYSLIFQELHPLLIQELIHFSI